jgi:hypothetical protein
MSKDFLACNLTSTLDTLSGKIDWLIDLLTQYYLPLINPNTTSRAVSVKRLVSVFGQFLCFRSLFKAFLNSLIYLSFHSFFWWVLIFCFEYVVMECMKINKFISKIELILYFQKATWKRPKICGWKKLKHDESQ